MGSRITCSFMNYKDLHDVAFRRFMKVRILFLRPIPSIHYR
jgi:hypothetical protein